MPAGRAWRNRSGIERVLIHDIEDLMKSLKSTTGAVLCSMTLQFGSLGLVACNGEGDSEDRGFEELGLGGMGGWANDFAVERDCAISGNIEFDELPSTGSVAFVLVGGSYRFIKQPGMTDTSISFVDSSCERAYGWSRDRPIDEKDARESSWVLDLQTMEFEEIRIPGTSWVVVRNGRDDGTVVGKLAVDSGTPGDSTDDESRGFVHDLASGETQLVERDGYSDIGFSGVNDDGLIVGFNDFGTLGFVYDHGEFIDLDHPEAYRLFPFQVTSSKRVVGFWGRDEDSWYDNSVSAAFIADFVDDEWRATLYELEGRSGTALTGINEAGQLVGLAYASSSSLPTVFTANDVETRPDFHPLGGDFEPFPTGISARGVVYGQVFVLEEPRPCGGHGVLEGEQCACDEGFLVDPYDTQNCLPPDAECSGHGHLHGDECHCDDGFKKNSEDESACLPS